MTRRAPQSAERGAAMLASILVMIVVSGFIAVLSIMTFGDGARMRSRTDRVAALPPADTGGHKYEIAIESGLASEFQGFAMNVDQLNVLADGPDGVARPNSWIAGNPSMAAKNLHLTKMASLQYEVTMEEPLKNGSHNFWQPYRITPVDDTRLIVYLRSWTTDASYQVATEPRLTRLEFRMMRLTDFLILVDGPIYLDSASSIDGPVRSSGYLDAYLIDMKMGAGESIHAEGSCTGNAKLETNGPGTIYKAGGCTSTASQVVTRPATPLRVERALRQMGTAQSCAAGGPVRCYTGTAVTDPALGPVYYVALNGASITVNGSSIAVTSSTALLFDNNVVLTGTLTSGQVTIGARMTAASGGTFGAASVFLRNDGSNSFVGVPQTAPSTVVLGLVVEGDVVADIDYPAGAPSCLTGVGAAVASQSGTITLPQTYRIPEVIESEATWTQMTQPIAPPPTCPTFTVHGSYSGHYAPLLQMEWLGDIDNIDVDGNPINDDKRAGFDTRAFEHDPDLASYSSPFFPVSGMWRLSSWRDANQDCLVGSRETEIECR